jgi:CDP-6-deoxy-D-xylo-4-hexulose-3-dehydrase
MSEKLSSLKKEILEKTREYQRQRKLEERGFDKSMPRVPVSGKVFDGDDVSSLVDASLEFWLTAGKFADKFEAKLSATMGLKHALMVNSGSSANLVALSALMCSSLGSARIRRNDEVITSATSFPTTVNPIIQNGLVPVFIDIELENCNPDISSVEGAITERTKAVMLAHTLGNPFDAVRLERICNKHNLYLIEDCCDALGATINGKSVGTFGDFATLSFYPAHHITTGEGGAVLTDDDALKRAAESMRDWGRDCWCKPGCDNTCGKRFGWSFPNLPEGYDHKYIYSNIGYNLKGTDMQAAVGITQLDKLPEFVQARRNNFGFYFSFFKKFEKFFIMPNVIDGANASPFGYLVNIKEGAPFARKEIVTFLEKNGIATRMLFGGNIARQPAYADSNYRAFGNLKNADHAMRNAFWIGVYPGITHEMLEYVAETLERFLAKY